MITSYLLSGKIGGVTKLSLLFFYLLLTVDIELVIFLSFAFICHKSLVSPWNQLSCYTCNLGADWHEKVLGLLFIRVA